MSQYNILQPLWMSFYSKKLYRDVAANWNGKSFLYLLILLALSWILMTYQIQKIMVITYNTLGDNFASQIPVLTLTKGKIKTPENRPYFIYAPSSHQTVAIIDTSGQYTRLDQTNVDFLVTETQLITKPKPNEVTSRTFPSNFSAVIKPLDINQVVKSFLSYLWGVIFIFAWLGSFVYRVVQALFYSLIGKIFSLSCNINLTYGQIIQISLISITPTIILASILNFFTIFFPHQLLVYFLLGILYLFFGISANKTEIKVETKSN